MDIRLGVSAAWGKWNKCNGVLCERDAREAKVGDYRTVVRPALVYGADRHGQ